MRFSGNRCGDRRRRWFLVGSLGGTRFGPECDEFRLQLLDDIALAANDFTKVVLGDDRLGSAGVVVRFL